MRNINIRLFMEDMPEDIHAWSGTKDGEKFDIVLNSKGTEDQQAASFLHEALHIFYEDHTSTRPAGELEAERHEQMKRIFKELTAGTA